MRERTRRALWFCGALVLAGGAGLSAGNAADGPQNSHRAVFGVGWECDWGYRREGNGCAPVDLPENAHITAAGNIWECNRGFRRKGGACAAIDLPEHAFLSDTSFAGWQCEVGYVARKIGRASWREECVRTGRSRGSPYH